MKLLLSTLLLVSLSALSSWSVSSGTSKVTQTPDVSVTEWEAVSITCCWTEAFEKITVNWLKNQTNIKSESISSNTGSRGSLPKEKCSTLSFSKITRQDSGTYICRVSVEIPVYTAVEGNGTVITVTARENTRDNTDVARGSGIIIPVPTRDSRDDNTYKNTAGDAPQKDMLIHIMRCLPILALIITFIYLYNSVTKAQQHTPAAPENKPASAQSSEEDREEEEKTEEETEDEKGEKEDNAISDD